LDDLAGAAVALVTAALITPLVRWLALRWRMLDHPNARSSHRNVTPRGGGLAIAVALAAALVVHGMKPTSSPALMAVCGGMLLVGLVGFWDDRAGLPASVRLLFHLAAAVPVAVTTGGVPTLPLPAPFDLATGPLAEPLAVLWMVAVLNFYNFLDGIDGLAGIQAVITGTAIALAGWDSGASAIGAALAGGSLGFLFWNWAPARIFMGDVGSGLLGFGFAALPFLAAGGRRGSAVFVVAISLWLFLADALWTLASRVRRGARFYEAHREHAYQRIVAGGRSHAAVTSAMAGASTVLSLLALLAWYLHRPPIYAAALATGLAAFALELAAARGATRGEGAMAMSSTR
jgi:Fuc2NAc and GlcNAc transferase